MSHQVILSQSESAQLWFAKLALTFKHAADRTTLERRQHWGPVRVQKMLWPEKNGICHVILVHPPAGIAGGDHLSFEIVCGQGAHAVLTTPGAGKWYKTNQKRAYQYINLQVDAGAILEWLPQETMLFNGAHAHTQTRVQLHQDAGCIVWDMLVIGRQARDESFEIGQYRSEMLIQREAQLLLHDVLNFAGNDRFLKSSLGMNGHAVMGSFYAIAPTGLRNQDELDRDIEQMRDLITRMQISVRITRLNDLISARYLGDDVRQCHDAFAALRAKCRQMWWQLDEAFPRIWRT